MDIANKYREICEQLIQYNESERQAYGDTFHEVYEDIGLVSAITMIARKYNNLRHLAKNPSALANLNSEQLESILWDLANYSILTLIEMSDGASIDWSKIEVPTEQVAPVLPTQDTIKEKKDNNFQNQTNDNGNVSKEGKGNVSTEEKKSTDKKVSDVETNKSSGVDKGSTSRDPANAEITDNQLNKLLSM